MQFSSPQHSARLRSRKRTRLSEADWARAGLEALADSGIEGIRVDPLAKRLGVTKGSFYWHFKGRDELLDAMVRFWGDTEPGRVIRQVRSLSAGPEKRLELLGKVYRR